MICLYKTDLSRQKQISGCLGGGPGVEKGNYKGAQRNYGVINMSVLTVVTVSCMYIFQMYQTVHLKNV